MQKTANQKSWLLGLLVTGLLLTGCQSQPAAKTTTPTTPKETTPTTVTSLPMQNQTAKTGDTIATIETDKGTIKFKIFTDQVPEISKNFIELAKSGKYDNVPFHRIIKDFMIQTGDFTAQNGTGGYSYKGPGSRLDDEIVSSLHHLKGTVSMANAGPNTNGSQFFIVTADQGTPFLDGKYSIFGQVTEGQDIVDAISLVKTGAMDKPETPVMMKKVTITTL